jgi:hypothetical protein
MHTDMCQGKATLLAQMEYAACTYDYILELPQCLDKGPDALIHILPWPADDTRCPML